MGNINNLAKKAKKNRKIAEKLKEDSVAIKDVYDNTAIMYEIEKLNKAYKQSVIALTQTEDAYEQLEKDSNRRGEYEAAIDHLKKSISEMERLRNK